MSYNSDRVSTLFAGMILVISLAAGERLAAGQDQTKTIGSQAVQTVRIKPQIDFTVRSFGGALLGLVGQLAIDKPTGAALVERFGIADPSLRVRDTFLAAIALDPSRVKLNADPRKDDDVSRILAFYNDRHHKASHPDLA